MSDNPYQASIEPAESAVPQLVLDQRADLKWVATYQRRVLICILLHLTFVAISPVARQLQFTWPLMVTYAGLVVTWLAVNVLVYLLASKIHRRSFAILLAALSIVPIFGLLALLFVHVKANAALRQNGVALGFMGANPTRL